MKSGSDAIIRAGTRCTVAIRDLNDDGDVTIESVCDAITNTGESGLNYEGRTRPTAGRETAERNSENAQGDRD
jgi:hypothetical protein